MNRLESKAEQRTMRNGRWRRLGMRSYRGQRRLDGGGMRRKRRWEFDNKDSENAATYLLSFSRPA